MTRPVPDNERFLSRWSRLKRAQKESGESALAPATRPSNIDTASASASARAARSSATDPASASVYARASIPGTDSARVSISAPASGSNAIDGGAPAELPPIESLTMESDYAQFFQPKVPEALRRAAVKKLFADPHFNIMDGLDTYIDDYSKPDPLPPEMLARLWHARDIIDHPSNRKAEVVETEALAAATPDAQAPAKPAVAEEMVFTDPACRPREGGDPATFDAGERSDPAKPDESHWVPACAGTTGLLTLPGTTDLLTLPGTTDLLTLSGTTDSHDCAGTMDSPGCDGTTDAPVPTASDKPPGTTA